MNYKKLSEDHRHKISCVLKGRKLSKKITDKMSASRKGKPQKQIQCPFCGKVGGNYYVQMAF